MGKKGALLMVAIMFGIVLLAILMSYLITGA